MSDQTIIVPRAPRTVGKYRIDGVLGEGAMGVVYAGHDPDIDREVAIKTVHRHLIDAAGGEEWLERFAREARAAGRVLHQNLVTIFDYLEQNDVPFLVMERVSAVTLEDQIASQPRIALEQVHGIVGQILDGLAHIHKAGIVHRDMKPANVMLTDDGGVKLTDFGIARLTAMDATGAGMVGTPTYMAPEQFTGGDVDERADIYACGVMLYEMVTGSKPFKGGGVEALFQAVRSAEIDPPSEACPDLPAEMDAVILRAMSVDPEDRFPDANALAAALAQCLPQANTSRIGEQTLLPRKARPGSEGPQTMLLRMSSQTMGQIEQHLIEKMGPMGRIIARRAASSSMDADDMISAVVAELSAVDEHDALRGSLLSLISADKGAGSNINDKTQRLLAELLKTELGPIADVMVRRDAAKARDEQDLIEHLALRIENPGKRRVFTARASAELSLSQGCVRSRRQTREGGK